MELLLQIVIPQGRNFTKASVDDDIGVTFSFNILFQWNTTTK